MPETIRKRAKVVGVLVQLEDGSKGFAILTESEKKLLTGALIDVAGQFLQITTPVNGGKIQTRGGMMPVDWSKYPTDWPKITLRVKTEADWKCELCGKQCRRPGEHFMGHRYTLTTSHKNHNEADCSRGNLWALCAPCHLRYDAPMKAAKRHPANDPKQKGLFNANS